MGMIWGKLMLNLIIPFFFSQSPLFLMFLDCVWQLLEQYPAAFEFSEVYLTILHDSARISLFGTFLFNCPHQRVKESTVSRRGCPCLASRTLQPGNNSIPVQCFLCVLPVVTLCLGLNTQVPRWIHTDFQVICAETVTNYTRRKSIEFICGFFPRKTLLLHNVICAPLGSKSVSGTQAINRISRFRQTLKSLDIIV